MTKTYVSLTSIPPRFRLLSETLESILDQNYKVSKIFLNIPAKYTNRKFEKFDLPRLPKGVEILRCAVDYGPATKIIPLIDKFKDQDVKIIYCDDDRIYPSNWCQALSDCSDQFPNDCICNFGEKVDELLIRTRAGLSHRKFLNVLTLGYTSHIARKRVRAFKNKDQITDIAKGFGGVLIKPKFFNSSVSTIPKFAIPVDDIWLSGKLAINGVAIRKISKGISCGKTRNDELLPLEKTLFNALDRYKLNLDAIRHLRAEYKIWLDSTGY